MINSVPLTEINKTHTSISNIGIDSYVITVSTTPSVSGESGVAEVGGTVFASENFRFELMQSAISTLELDGTQITSKLGQHLQQVLVEMKHLLQPLHLQTQNISTW